MHHLIPLVVLFIVVWAFALYTGRDLAYNLAYLTTGVIGGSWLWARSNMRGLCISRSTRARRAQVGRYAEEYFELYNAGRLPKLWIELRDYSDLPGHGASRVINSLGPGRRRRWLVRTLCMRRGRYVLGPVTVTSGDPLGLFRLQRRLPATSSFVVYPATVELPGFQPPGGQLSGGEARPRRTHYVTSKVSTVREYAPGDAFNRIHWRSVARTDRLMVKEFELDPTADIFLFLDMYRGVQAFAPDYSDFVPQETSVTVPWLTPSIRSELPPSTVEYGVTVAASLAQHFLARDRAIGLIAYAAQRQAFPADRGHRHLDRILETLAVLEGDGNVPFEQVLALEGRYLTRNTTVIAISSDASPEWIAALRELARRGVSSVVVLVAAESFNEAPSYQGALYALAVSRVPAYVVHRGEALDAALSQLARPGQVPGWQAATGARPIPSTNGRGNGSG